MKETNLKAEKKVLRTHIQQGLKNLSPSQHEAASSLIHQHLCNDETYQKAKSILLFLSMPEEPDTRRIIKAAAKDKKHLFLPRVSRNGLEICPYRIGDTLKRHRSFPIDEPIVEGLEILSDIDLAIIPGLAFGRNGDRLGHGGGYYDRLIPKLSCPCMGLAFGIQLYENIPMDRLDMRVDRVLTEQGILL